MEPTYGMPREDLKKKKKRRENIFRAFFSGFDFFWGGGYCKDLHPWVRHVVIPLTCGYTWSSMWLHLARTWLHLLKLLSYCLPLSLYYLHILCINMSLSAQACLSAYMLCFIIFYYVLCIQLLCTYYYTSPFISLSGKSCRQCTTSPPGY